MGRPRRRAGQTGNEEREEKTDSLKFVKTVTSKTAKRNDVSTSAKNTVVVDQRTQRNYKPPKNVLKTPKSKARTRTTELPDAFRSALHSGLLNEDLICSQHLDPDAEVCWDANSPDALRHIQFVSKSQRDQVDDIRDIVKKLTVPSVDDPSCTPPLLGIWMNKEDADIFASPEKVRPSRHGRSGHSRSAGRQAAEVMPDDLMKQLAKFVQEHEDQKVSESGESVRSTKADGEKSAASATAVNVPSSSSTQSSPVSRGSHRLSKRLDMRSPRLPGGSPHSSTSQTPLADIHRASPQLNKQKASLADGGASDLWDSEEDDLFNDDSLLRATQATESLFDCAAQLIASPRPAKRHMTSTPEGGKPSKASRYTFQLPQTQHLSPVLEGSARHTTPCAASAVRKTSTVQRTSTVSAGGERTTAAASRSESLPVIGVSGQKGNTQHRTEPAAVMSKTHLQSVVAQQRTVDFPTQQKTAPVMVHQKPSLMPVHQKSGLGSKQTTLPLSATLQQKVTPATGHQKSTSVPVQRKVAPASVSNQQKTVNTQQLKNTKLEKKTAPLSQTTSKPTVQNREILKKKTTLGVPNSRHVETLHDADDNIIPPTAEPQPEEWRDESLTDDILCQLIEPDEAFHCQLPTANSTVEEVKNRACNTVVPKSSLKSKQSNVLSAAQMHKSVESHSTRGPAATVDSSKAAICTKISGQNKNPCQSSSGQTLNKYVDSLHVSGAKQNQESSSVNRRTDSVSHQFAGTVGGVMQSGLNQHQRNISSNVSKTVTPVKSAVQLNKKKQPSDVSSRTEELTGEFSADKRACEEVIEDSFLDDDMLAEPELLAMLDAVETQHSQMPAVKKAAESSVDTSTAPCQPPAAADEPLQCTPEQIKAKREEALRRRRNKQSCSTKPGDDVMLSQGYLSSQESVPDDCPLQCSPEQIKAKREEALRRRRNSLSTRNKQSCSTKGGEDVMLSQGYVSSQESVPDDCPLRCTPEQIEVKRQEAIRRRHNSQSRSRKSEHDLEELLSQNSIPSQGSSDEGPSQCTPEEIEKKKQEAIRRRQNRLKMQEKK